jgi:succinate-semialdehyde dehydrogenase/glutarate-semialdehyde dehydrogenase
VRKLSAALAAGCSIIVKAPEETPASPAELIRAFADAGVLPGSVNLVYGDPAAISSYLIPHPVIRKISFTGSTVVGKQLAALAGQHMKRMTMELGGHAPVIVFDDADAAISGQDSMVGQQVPQRRAGVHLADALPGAGRHLRASFVEQFVAHGQGDEGGQRAGGRHDAWARWPIRAARPRWRPTWTTRASTRRNVRTGGKRIGNEGNFFEPTVMTDCRPTRAR